MPHSVASVFSNPKDFQAALSKYGVFSLLVTGSGRFRARLTQIVLDDMCLAAGEEELSRVACCGAFGYGPGLVAHRRSICLDLGRGGCARGRDNDSRPASADTCENRQALRLGF